MTFSPASRTLHLRPKESQEQSLFFKWLDYVTIDGHDLRPHCYAVPNGGSRHVVEAVNLKRQGVTPGVPDICVDVPAGKAHGLRLEMKRVGARPTPAQVEMLELRRSMGYAAVITEGFDAARRETVKYLAQSWLVTDRWVG